MRWAMPMLQPTVFMVKKHARSPVMRDLSLNPKSQYLIYKTSLKHEEHEVVFVKSKKSDRWWMQVPYPTGGSMNERFHLVPCQYEDYKTAVAGEMPDLWWRTFQKLN